MCRWHRVVPGMGETMTRSLPKARNNQTAYVGSSHDGHAWVLGEGGLFESSGSRDHQIRKILGQAVFGRNGEGSPRPSSQNSWIRSAARMGVYLVVASTTRWTCAAESWRSRLHRAHPNTTIYGEHHPSASSMATRARTRSAISSVERVYAAGVLPNSRPPFSHTFFAVTCHRTQEYTASGSGEAIEECGLPCVG